MSKTPETASQHECPTRCPARSHRRDGSKVVRLQGVLHADQTTKN